MNPAPPFIRPYLWNSRVEVEISVTATPIFDHNFVGPHNIRDPRYVQVRFGVWSFRTASDHEIPRCKITKQAYIEAAAPLIQRFKLEPPLLDVQPGFLGYLSQPPTPNCPLRTYVVWCSGPDNYALRRLVNGPLMSSHNRFRVRTIKGVRDRLPAAALEWFWRYGFHMDSRFDGGRPSRLDMAAAWGQDAITDMTKEEYIPQPKDGQGEYVEKDPVFDFKVKLEVKEEVADADLEAEWAARGGAAASGSVPAQFPEPSLLSDSPMADMSSLSTPPLSLRPPTPYPTSSPDSEVEDDDEALALMGVEALLSDQAD